MNLQTNKKEWFHNLIFMNEISKIYEHLIATILLSLIHGTIPNHWLPFVVISKTNQWSFKQLAIVVSIGAFFHSLSTALLGIFISYLGYYTIINFSQLEKILPTFFMILLGMIYIMIENNKHNHELLKSKNYNIWLTTIALYIAMFFSPCLEIEAIYFSIGKYGIYPIILISILYTILSILSMLFFSFISYKGLYKFYPKFLEKYEKKIVGFILIILGIISFYY